MTSYSLLNVGYKRTIKSILKTLIIVSSQDKKAKVCKEVDITPPKKKMQIGYTCEQPKRNNNMAQDPWPPVEP